MHACSRYDVVPYVGQLATAGGQYRYPYLLRTTASTTDIQTREPTRSTMETTADSLSNERIPQDRGDYLSSSTDKWMSRGEGEDLGQGAYDSTNPSMNQVAAGFPSDGVEAGTSSMAMRPVFLGNLSHDATPFDVQEVFQRPFVAYAPEGSNIDPNAPVGVDHVDMKRGFCFVFLKDATSEADKLRVEHFVSELNGL